MRRVYGLVALGILLWWSVYAAVPGAVENLHSTTHVVNQWSNEREITFCWDPASNATGYSYVFDQSNATEPDAETEVQGGDTSCVSVVAQSDGEYYFHIRAVGINGEPGPVATIGPFLIDTTAPSRVLNFSATPGDGRVVLSWTAPADRDLGRIVIRYSEAVGGECTYPETKDAGMLVADIANPEPGADGSFVHANLENGITYCYSAFACDQAGNCAVAVTVNATPRNIGVVVGGVSPTEGDNTETDFPLTITGEGFAGAVSSQVKLMKGEYVVEAKSIKNVDDTEVTAVFDLTRLPAGNYDVCVKGGCLQDGFSVADNRPPVVTMSPSCPSNGVIEGYEESGVKITLSANEPGVNIYYTLDGSLPDANSTLYTSPVVVSKAGRYVLKFIGKDKGGNWSEVKSCEIKIYSQSTTVVGGSGAAVGGEEKQEEQPQQEEQQQEVDLENMKEELMEAASDGVIDRQELVSIVGSGSGELDPQDMEVIFESGAREVNFEGFTITGEVEIPEGTKVAGVKIKGRVRNGGELSRIRLVTGARIEGGVVSGEVVGEVDVSELLTSPQDVVTKLPEIEGAVVKADAESVKLEKVVLKDVKFEVGDVSKLQLGEGVVMDEATVENLSKVLPDKLDITNTVPKVYPSTERVIFDFKPSAPDFPVMISSSGEPETPASLISSVLSDFGTAATVESEPDQGLIKLELGNLEVKAAVRSVAVLSSSGSSFAAVDEEVKALPDGSALVRRGKLVMIVVPMLHDPEEFDHLIAVLGNETGFSDLKVKFEENGLLLGSYYLGDQEVKFSMVTSGLSYPSEQAPSEVTATLDDKGRVLVKYTDGKEEVLPPAPVSLDRLGEFLSTIDGVEWAFDRASGRLTVKLDGETYVFIADYNYRSPTAAELAEVELSGNGIVFKQLDDKCILVITASGVQKLCRVQ